MPAATPDGRYIVVDGRLWRASNPGLAAEARQALVDELMAARRAVKAALGAGDSKALKTARSRVQAAKEALGERGPVWWEDGAPDLNRRRIENTPYARWWQGKRSARSG
ncbi:MAG: hypothetical protein ABWX67_14325 [Allosphingosinicella sp.]